jgi:hypothetical protein
MLLESGSSVLLRDIGEGGSALYCLTDRVLCCSPEAGQNRGAWRFPNTASVGENTAAGIYLTRGFSSLHLNRQNGVMGPTGVYRCFIPDAGDSSSTSRTLTITLLNGEFEEWFNSSIN